MNQQPEQKIYVPRSIIREKTFNSGKSILTLGLHVDETIAFLKQHANAKGYVNLGISATREVGKLGQTHCLWLDTWEPKQQPQAGYPAQKTQPPISQHVRTTTAANATEVDDVPF